MTYQSIHYQRVGPPGSVYNPPASRPPLRHWLALWNLVTVQDGKTIWPRPSRLTLAQLLFAAEDATARAGPVFCLCKGLCGYYDIGEARRAAWSCEDARTEVRRISGMVSFEPDKVEVHLVGARPRLGPGQSVIPPGPDRDLSADELAPGRQA